ncbi:MAG TPA: UDP-2,4-diacetamido-2,4,6-trideoxy-beta-L-altropyranose hydrolase [Planctomycetota bacterium]|nr:UDP-2,4-diacetamido-2,4,6-trideoxy-beta-L-altropyranose hydrolase [Planctomycetota bacterium]
MHLLLRADASESIGTGHVMRSLAIAQAWKRAGGTASFAMSCCPPTLCERLREEGVEIVSLQAGRATLADATETAERARALGARWVVLDGYDFDETYQSSLRKSGLSTLLVDDEALAQRFTADLLLNQNAYATADLYAHKAHGARLALGGRYALLRDEFEPWRLWRREIPERARRILITTGGSDPTNAAGEILRGIEHLADRSLELQLVIGSAAAHREALERQAAALGARGVIDARNMPELMAWADIAITAAGSTCWEMAFMGTPALTLVIADNQQRIATCLCERGAARSLGRSRDCDPAKIADALASLLGDRLARATLSRAGRRLIDGRGASRVVALLQEAA